MKAVALAAAERGWRVFPLRPGTTEPAVRDWAERATTDARRIELCWDTGPYNVGLAPCASGLVVLDLLPARGEQPPQPYRLPGVHDGSDVLAMLLEEHQQRMPVTTYTVRTPGGGQQLYFQRPARRCPTQPPRPLAWHVEVRCTRSYVPVAGSIAAEGAYTLLHDAVPEPCPPWLAGHLSATRPRRGRRA
ncbi:bifunctional DNA primase/polymerase [Streptomyces javensis]